MTDFAAWAQACQARMESVLAGWLPSSRIAPQHLHEAMRYAVLDGGKRVRPLLALAAGDVTGADPERVQRAAAAVELVHAYSRVHDDMPAMDDDGLPRGMPGAQAIDLASVCKQLDLHELEFLNIHKTGALIRSAVLLGAHCGKVT